MSTFNTILVQLHWFNNDFSLVLVFCLMHWLWQLSFDTRPHWNHSYHPKIRTSSFYLKATVYELSMKELNCPQVTQYEIAVYQHKFSIWAIVLELQSKGRLFQLCLPGKETLSKFSNFHKLCCTFQIRWLIEWPLITILSFHCNKHSKLKVPSFSLPFNLEESD